MTLSRWPNPTLNWNFQKPTLRPFLVGIGPPDLETYTKRLADIDLLMGYAALALIPEVLENIRDGKSRNSRTI